MKEVDPQVNWAALVEEKLVRPWLQLGRGRVSGENPTISCHHSHGEVVVLVMFSDVCVNEESEAQRGAVPDPESHSRGDED